MMDTPDALTGGRTYTFWQNMR